MLYTIKNYFMGNKKIIILIILTITLILAVGFFYYFTKDKPAPLCAKEGERVRAAGTSFPVSCCSNLKAMLGYAQEDCNAPGLTGDIGVCSNCGNGNCETQNNENKCNCPDDCK